VEFVGFWGGGIVGEVTHLEPLVAVLDNHIDGIWVLSSGVAVSNKIVSELDWGCFVSEEVIMSKIVTENEGGNGGKLDENVDSWTGSILKWITDGITDNSSDVLLSELEVSGHPLVVDLLESLFVEDFWTVLDFETVLSNLTSVSVGKEFVVLELEGSKVDTSFFSLSSEFRSVGFDFLLGVIPSTTGVGLGDSDLDTGNDGTGEDTSGGVWTEDESSEEWGTDNEDTWSNHLLEGSFSGDLDATFIVWLVVSTGGFGLLTGVVILDDEVHHVISGITDSSHGEGSEPVWEHSTDKESSELGWLKDIDGGITDSGNESTEEGKTDEASGSDSETFTDSGGGVSCGIEGISEISDFGWESGHFSDSSGIVGDWSISINGKGDWEGSEHTEGGKTDTVHTSVGETVSDGSSDAGDWDNDGNVTEGKTKDNVWCWTFVASVSEPFGWGVGVVGVVFSDESDDHTGPESEHDASISGPSFHGEWDFLGTTFEGEGFWENEDSWDDASSHDDGGSTNLELKDGLNVGNGDNSHVSEED